MRLWRAPTPVAHAHVEFVRTFETLNWSWLSPTAHDRALIRNAKHILTRLFRALSLEKLELRRCCLSAIKLAPAVTTRSLVIDMCLLSTLRCHTEQAETGKLSLGVFVLGRSVCTSVGEQRETWPSDKLSVYDDTCNRAARKLEH